MIDGMVVREMNRRCNYHYTKIKQAHTLLKAYCGDKEATSTSQWISIKLIDSMYSQDMNTCCRLRDLCENILQHKSGPLLCIHDNFLAPANHMNKVRYWYKEILAELCESDLLQDLLRQLYKSDSIEIQKIDPDLPKHIRNSNYGLS